MGRVDRWHKVTLRCSTHRAQGRLLQSPDCAEVKVGSVQVYRRNQRDRSTRVPQTWRTCRMRARKGLIACRCLNGEDFGLHAYKALLWRGASAGKLLVACPMTGLTAEGASVRRAFGSGRGQKCC